MDTPRESFRKDKRAVQDLKDVLSEAWFVRAVQSAQLIHNRKAKSVDEIRGAADFVGELASLAEPDAPSRTRIKTGVNHETIDRHARTDRPPTSSDSSTGSPSSNAEASSGSAKRAPKGA